MSPAHLTTAHLAPRHAYSEQAGKNVANPAAMLLCSANFLAHAGLASHAATVRRAVLATLREGRVKTKDLGGHSTTRQFTAAVVAAMGSQADRSAEGTPGKAFTFGGA